MKSQFFLAAAIVCASGAVQATTSFSSELSNGVNTIDISLSDASADIFSESVTFDLGGPGNVIGSLSGVSGDVTLLEVSVQKVYSLEGVPPVIRVTPTEISGLSTFNLGQLSAPTGMSFENGRYTLSLLGLKDAGVSSLQLSLNVSSVPEPTTWAMLALGLAGLAGAHRARMARALP